MGAETGPPAFQNISGLILKCGRLKPFDRKVETLLNEKYIWDYV